MRSAELDQRTVASTAWVTPDAIPVRALDRILKAMAVFL
jgi:hypothetical protein